MVGGRRPSVEDNLRWKMSFSGRQPLTEDDLRWKMNFGECLPSVEDNFGGRRPSVEDDFRWVCLNSATLIFFIYTKNILWVQTI